MVTLLEPAKSIPVLEEVDVCVLGGSCTGVFAAVRAARLGVKVAIVEKQNCFGGVATAGLVNVWHSLTNNTRDRQIIGGLTQEVIERLKKRDAVIDYEKELKTNDFNAYRLNTEELKIELDELVKESGVKAYLHSWFAAPFIEDGELSAIVVENKSGRWAIRAGIFIDATGDGDLCKHLGVPSYTSGIMQPPTYCAKIMGTPELAEKGFDLQDALVLYGKEFGLTEDWGWGSRIPNAKGVWMHAETHVFNVNCAAGDHLTYSEMEGRRQIRAIMDIARKYADGGKAIALLDLASVIGVRETCHFKSGYKITNEDLLYGKHFEDSIANGSYRVDIHHSDGSGITFRYLDGSEHIIYGRGKNSRNVYGRWKEETTMDATYYQIPYRSLLPQCSYDNLLVCGRMIDAEEEAFSALRVMVNLNQTGEAAGVAAYCAANQGIGVGRVDALELRKRLSEGGSIIL